MRFQALCTGSEGRALPSNKQISFETIHRFLRTLFAADLHAKRILSLAGATLGGDRVCLACGRTEVAPVRWTPRSFRERCSTWPRHIFCMRRSSGARWSSWCAPGVIRRTWLVSLSRHPRRSATGWRRLTARRAAGKGDPPPAWCINRVVQYQWLMLAQNRGRGLNRGRSYRCRRVFRVGCEPLSSTPDWHGKDPLEIARLSISGSLPIYAPRCQEP